MVTRKALVTGATGGLGRTLVPMLVEAGYSVTATGRNKTVGAELASAGARLVLADLLTDPLDRLVESADVVFHLAALSSPWGTKRQFQAINVDLTDRLLGTAREAGCGAFVFASTPSIYAEPRDRIGLTEESPPARSFANHYAETKYAAERAVIAANSPEFRTIVIRPRAIVGVHDMVLLPRLMRAAGKGIFPLPNHGKALIELTDVRDAAAAFLAADRARSHAAGHVFNISGGRPRALRDVVRTIFDHMNTSVRLVPVPARPAMVAARLSEMIAALLPGRPEPPATRYSIMALAYSQTFDLSAARARLGWAPRYDPDQAIVAALTGGAKNA